MKLMTESLSFARSLIGVCEEPRGSNSGREILAFLKSTGIETPAPWCASFVYYCIAKAMDELGAVNPFAALNGKAWTPSWLAWADAHGEKLTGRGANAAAKSGRPLLETSPVSSENGSSPALAPGMFFLLYYPKLKRVGHIGFIASPLDAYLLLRHNGDSLAICDRGYNKKYVELTERAGKSTVSAKSVSGDCRRAVDSLLARGLVATIEGNTDPVGSRTGGGVFLRTRKLQGLHRIAGY